MELSPCTMLAVVRRNGKIVYLGEPGHIRRTRAFTWRKFWVRGGLVWVCFGHSQSDPFQHRLHVSGLTGGLQPSPCLPVFSPALSLQIHVFASPCPLAELALLLRDCVTCMPSLQKGCWHLLRAGRTQMARCHGRASSRAGLVPTRVQGRSGFRKMYRRHAGLLVLSPV